MILFLFDPCFIRESFVALFLLDCQLVFVAVHACTALPQIVKSAQLGVDETRKPGLPRKFVGPLESFRFLNAPGPWRPVFLGRVKPTAGGRGASDEEGIGTGRSGTDPDALHARDAGRAVRWPVARAIPDPGRRRRRGCVRGLGPSSGTDGSGRLSPDASLRA